MSAEPALAPVPLNPEAFSLPILEETDASLFTVDVLDHAVQDRKGIALIGPKGVGKSTSLELAVRDFEDAEQGRANAEGRKAYRVVRFLGSRTKKRRDMLLLIREKILGQESVQPRRRERLKTDDELLQELVALLLATNVCALAVDEAENLSSEAVLVLRDTISEAEHQSRARRYSDGRIRASGVGVVMAGTRSLLSKLAESGEMGQRWIRVQYVNELSPACAARVYRRFLGAFEQRALATGDKAWGDFIRIKVAAGKDVPIRHIENHVRAYVRRMAIAYPDVADFDDLPYDEELFFETLQEMARQAE